jgi:hypothetical protein
LEDQGAFLNQTQKGWFATFLDKTGLAAFYSSAYARLVGNKQADTVAGKVAKEMGETAQKEADEAASKIVSQTPEAKPVVDAAGEVAKGRAAREGAETVGDTAGSAIARGKGAVPEKPSKAEPGMLSRLLSAGLAKGSETSITGMALKGAAGLVGKVLTYALIFSAVGAAGYLIWKTYVRKNAPVVKKEVDLLEMRINDSIEKLETLKFKRLSNGDDVTDNLTGKLKETLAILPSLYNYRVDDAALKEAFETLEEVQDLVNKYLDDKEVIQRDLEEEIGWPEALASLEALNNQLSSIKLMVYEAMEGEDTEEVRPDEGGIAGPIGRPEKEPEEAEEERKAEPVPIRIYGEDIDISHTSAGFRSAAPRMIEKILNTPEGLAFIDPENRWGGYLRKSGNNKNDYLRSLYYLYKNQIFSIHQLKRFIRKNMMRASKRRLSGWKNAIKYYRGRVGRYVKAYLSKNLHKNLQKPANFLGSSVQSDDRLGIDMRKKADQISKDYFQDAVKGLSDQYAKSYYTGLKSMYDQKLGKTEADYNSLYELHSETGAELVGEAHPLSIDIADAMGRGGVVENVVEQHRHNEGVALSMPSGNFRGKHAWLVENLVKLADATDENGMREASDLIDAALEEIVSL